MMAILGIVLVLGRRVLVQPYSIHTTNHTTVHCLDVASDVGAVGAIDPMWCVNFEFAHPASGASDI